MQQITNIDVLRQMQANAALLVLFGGKHCAVCQSVQPQITAMLEKHYPDIHSVYIDCEASPELCAQHGVFTLPVVKFYIDGMLILENARAFSIQQLMQNIERPYAIWKET